MPPQAMAGYATVAQFHLTYILGAAFPAVAGVMLFGWRATAMLGLMLAVAGVTLAIWKRVGMRGRQLKTAGILWQTLLIWMMLPAHLMQTGHSGDHSGSENAHLWAIPVGAAMLGVMIAWVLASSRFFSRVHPAIATFLLLAWAFGPQLAPSYVLQRHRLWSGDLLSATPPPPPAHAYIKDGYLKSPPLTGYDALELDPPARRLLAFTSGRERPGRSWLSIESLLRDQMPPLEDLVIGAQPGPIGSTCAVAVIIGGLFLLYRGVIDYRVPLTICIGAYIGLLALPIPVIIRDPHQASETSEKLDKSAAVAPPGTAGGPGRAAEKVVEAPLPSAALAPGQAQWRWLAFREKHIVQVGLAKAVTFANYQIMAGPMLLMTFFIATWPTLRPMARRGRILYGLLIGILAAGLQLYLSIAWGPYLALLIVSGLSPLLDRFFRQHPLV